MVDIQPTCGCKAEVYEWSGDGYRVQVRAGYTDTGQFTAWEDGKVAAAHAPAKDEPAFVTDGTYGETAAFLDALRDGRPPCPTPEAVLPSVELCHQVQNQMTGE